MLQTAKWAIDETNFDSYLEKIECRIKVLLESNDTILPLSAALLSSVVSHLCVEGHAKRVRPLLSWFFGDAVGINSHELLDLAVAAELFHSASLLHDDVVDAAHLRRGVPTANVRFNNSIAVLGGNHLLCLSFSLLHKYPQSITKEAIDVIGHMTRAAIAEIQVRGSIADNTDIWRQIAIGKTGRLFAWCGQSVAMLAKSPEAVAKFYRCGCHIGTAFQLTDDIRDLCDNRNLKDLFADIVNKEPSFPIIIAAKNNGAIKKELTALWSNETVSPEEAAQMGAKVISSGAIAETATQIKLEIERAHEALGEMINTTGGRHLSTWMSNLYRSSHTDFSH